MVTAHRREHRRALRILQGIKEGARGYDDVGVYAVHKNPAVRRLFTESGRHFGWILWMLMKCTIMGKCFMVMTDSGGLQRRLLPSAIVLVLV